MKPAALIIFFFVWLPGIQSAGAVTNDGLKHELSDIAPATIRSSRLIVQNNTDQEFNAYDPFADYSEFENTAEEQENINFFQTGRFLTLGTMGGIKLFTLNMAALYDVGPIYGGYLNYFFDLSFAIQFILTASNHNIALRDESGQGFVGAADFISIGVNFKYFVDRTLFNKNFSWLQPYFLLGILNSTITVAATFTDQDGFFEDSGYGLNMGLGLEFHFLKKIHIGLQYAFQFITLERESVPLVLNTGNGTQNTTIRPFGDWMHIAILLGVNF